VPTRVRLPLLPPSRVLLPPLVLGVVLGVLPAATPLHLVLVASTCQRVTWSSCCRQTKTTMAMMTVMTAAAMLAQPQQGHSGTHDSSSSSSSRC
jgi:hypothetical protein